MVGMVRRLVEEVGGDREKAICVSSRFFGFLTESGIMQLFELPHDCLTHKSSQVRYSFTKLQMIKNLHVQRKDFEGHKPKLHRFYK